MANPIANRTYDVGVTRDPISDTRANVENQGLITDIGVPVSVRVSTLLRDGPSMPNSKRRSDMDGPTPYNPKTGATGGYQR